MSGSPHRNATVVAHAGMITLLLLLVTTSTSTPATAEHRELTTTEILANVRRAVGYENLASYEQDILLTGRGEQLGLAGDVSLRVAPDGRILSAFNGRLDMRAAFDGQRGWIIDYRGLLRPLELEELELAQMQSWMISGHWLAETGPFAVSRAPERDSERELVLLLKRRDGCVRVHLHVDRTTWLPASMHRNSWIGPERWEFGGYREFAGFRIPTRVKYTSDIGNTETVKFDTIAAAPRTGVDPCARPKPPHHAARFDSDRPAEIKVRRSPVGWLLVHPMINGTDVGWFLFDTCGSALAITKTAAE